MKRAVFVLLCALVCLAPARALTPQEKQATIAFLHKHETKMGFLPDSTSLKTGVVVQPTLRATSAGIRALKYLGADVQGRKDLAANLLPLYFDKASGGFADVPGGKPDVFTTAVGLMAAYELKLPADSYLEPGVKYLLDNAKNFEEIRIAIAGLDSVGQKTKQTGPWLDQLAKLANPDGTYGKGPGQARATGGAVAAILRLGGKVENRDNVVKALKAGQRADGGFGKEEEQGSDLEATYRTMRAIYMLKEKPDEAKLRAFIAKCRNADGGYGLAPGQKSTVGSTYFAAIVLHWLDSK